MVAKLTVIFFIILTLMVGVFLTLLPWINFAGIVDWGDNYLLNYVSEVTGLAIIKDSVSSGWFRGAVTSLGVLNLFLAFWELAHFEQSVRTLEQEDRRIPRRDLKMTEK